MILSNVEEQVLNRTNLLANALLQIVQVLGRTNPIVKKALGDLPQALEQQLQQVDLRASERMIMGYGPHASAIRRVNVMTSEELQAMIPTVYSAEERVSPTTLERLDDTLLKAIKSAHPAEELPSLDEVLASFTPFLNVAVERNPKGEVTDYVLFVPISEQQALFHAFKAKQTNWMSYLPLENTWAVHHFLDLANDQAVNAAIDQAIEFYAKELTETPSPSPSDSPTDEGLEVDPSAGEVASGQTDSPES